VKRLAEIKVLNADGSATIIKHPIIIRGRAFKRTPTSIEIRGYKKKTAEFAIAKLQWRNIEQDSTGVLAFVRALEGKTIKVTIEIEQ